MLSTAARAEEVTSHLLTIEDSETRLANAFHYLEAMGHLVVAWLWLWLWLEQAMAAGRRECAFFDGKRLAAAYFFEYELPKTDAWFDLLESGSNLLVDMDVAAL